MIRYHRTDGAGLLVSSRRQPRGFVVPWSGYREFREGDERSYIRVSYREARGWKPVSFDGIEGCSFDTRNEAAHALLTWTSLQPREKRFTGTVYPNDPPPYQPRKRKKKTFWQKALDVVVGLFEML